MHNKYFIHSFISTHMSQSSSTFNIIFCFFIIGIYSWTDKLTLYKTNLDTCLQNLWKSEYPCHTYTQCALSRGHSDMRVYIMHEQRFWNIPWTLFPCAAIIISKKDFVASFTSNLTPQVGLSLKDLKQFDKMKSLFPEKVAFRTTTCIFCLSCSTAKWPLSHAYVHTFLFRGVSSGYSWKGQISRILYEKPLAMHVYQN